MQTPPAWEALKQFRLAAYRTLGRRKDSLFELMEAVLAGPGPATLVRLSLAAVFRRGWPSAPDALADGGVDADRCREVVQRTRIEPPGGRPVWALDGTVWPRPAAATSPERT
jgi:DDE superfamily endonuclease